MTKLASPQLPSATVLGLFAGIGGLELGLSRKGHHTSAFCEIDGAASEVLRVRFPGTPIYPDVTELKEVPSDVDLITGGFPCQDLSQAGRTLGIEGSRSGLVGEVFRLLRQRRVPMVLLENVSFMLRLKGGQAMDLIMRNLEELGYKWAYRVVDSRAFGLPQRRERVFILASLTVDPRDVLLSDDVPPPAERFLPEGEPCGFYWTEGTRGLGWAVGAVPTLKGGSTVGIPSPPAVWLPTGEIVTPSIEAAEALQGFPIGWTEPVANVGRASMRWKAVGNAVSVNVAEWIGERLRQPNAYPGRNDVPLRGKRALPDAAYNVGNGRFESPVSRWPVARETLELMELLSPAYRKPLSAKATAGFLSRFEKSSLRKPDGLIEALRKHLETFQNDAIAATAG